MGCKKKGLDFFVTQKEKRQPDLFSFWLQQIASRKKMAQTLKEY